MSEPMPNFYAIIPSHVRYCKELEPSAKLLYGEITALCSSEGYCWAGNGYFANLYGVSERTITNWISSLSKQGFIKIETTKEGIRSNRKIWISNEIKKMITKGKNLLPPTKKISTPLEKNFHHINTSITTLEKETPPTPLEGEGACDSFESHGKFVKLKKEEFLELVKMHGEPLVKDMINQINDYIASKGKKPYADYAATIRSWIRRRKDDPKKTPSPQGNSLEDEKLARMVKKKFPMRREIEVGYNYIEFNLGPRNFSQIKFGESGFRDQVLNKLKKMNLNTEGL